MFDKLKKAHEFMLKGSNFIESLNEHPLSWLIKLLDKKATKEDKDLSSYLTEEAINTIVKKKDVFQPIKSTNNAQKIACYVYKLGQQDKTVAERFLKEFAKKYNKQDLAKRAYKYLKHKKFDELYKKMNFSNTLTEDTDELVFMEDSTPLIERLLDIKFKKGNKRMIKTIINYIKKIPYQVYIKRTSWNSCSILNKDNKLLMSLTLNDNPYITEQAQESKKEQHDRFYKVTDIKEIIDFIVRNTENVSYKPTQNFSIVDWMYEHRLPPDKLFQLRIVQSINYCRNNNLRSIKDNENVKNYIKSYLDTIFQKSLKSPESFDFVKGLRLALYVPPYKFAQFNLLLGLVIERLKGESKNMTPPYVLVEKLRNEYDKVVNYIFDYCDRNILGNAMLS